MTKTTVFLQAINDVKEFVTIVMHYDFDIDLVSGRYAVDAKSIMGISLVPSGKDALAFRLLVIPSFLAYLTSVSSPKKR